VVRLDLREAVASGEKISQAETMELGSLGAEELSRLCVGVF
jgi:hypothetical protein